MISTIGVFKSSIDTTATLSALQMKLSPFLRLAIPTWIFILAASLPCIQSFSTTPTLTKHRSNIEEVGGGETVDLSTLEYCNGHDNAAKKTPVVFLHGLLGNKRNFNSIARSLCGRLNVPRRILGLDLRNHGDNEQRCNNMSYTSMAMDVLNFMDSNDIPAVELIGHSVGGKVAQ